MRLATSTRDGSEGDDEGGYESGGEHVGFVGLLSTGRQRRLLSESNATRTIYIPLNRYTIDGYACMQELGLAEFEMKAERPTVRYCSLSDGQPVVVSESRSGRACWRSKDHRMQIYARVFVSEGNTSSLGIPVDTVLVR